MRADSSADDWDDLDAFIGDDEAQREASAEAVVQDEEETPTRREAFAAWRKSRPFWPGLLVIISGIIMLAPAYFTIQISDLLVMISTISGVSTLLIGALLIMFGLGMWLQPAAVVYLGVLSILVALVALPTSNIGGFVVGTLTGIVGGSLAIAWENVERKPRSKRKENHVQAMVTALVCVGVCALSLADVRTVYAQETPPASESEQAHVGPGIEALIPPLPDLAVPELALPTLSLPEIAPPVPLPPPHLPIPDSLTVPGVGEVISPATEVVPPPGKPTPSAGTSIVTADSVSILGNVRVTLEDIQVAGAPKRALILTGDRLVANNLTLGIPGPNAKGLLSTGPVTTTVSNGPVRVIATGLSATPAVSATPTLPVAINLGGTVGTVLDQLGIPTANPVPQVNVPDAVMNEISLRNVTLEMVSLYGMSFNAPAVRLSVGR